MEGSIFTFDQRKGMLLLAQPTHTRFPMGFVALPAPTTNPPVAKKKKTNKKTLKYHAGSCSCDGHTSRAHSLPWTDHRATGWRGENGRWEAKADLTENAYKTEDRAVPLLSPPASSSQRHQLGQPQCLVGTLAKPFANPALQNSHFASFTYFPKNFLIPLAFFLESGEGGVICKLSVSFGRGGKPARSKWSADPFSVSAIRKQSSIKTCFHSTVQTHSWTLEQLYLKLLSLSSSFMGLTETLQGNVLAGWVGNKHLVN